MGKVVEKQGDNGAGGRSRMKIKRVRRRWHRIIR